MAGGDSTAIVAGIQSLLRLVQDVARSSGTGFTGGFKKDCTDLSRRVALLSHLLEEIRDFRGDLRPLDSSASSSSSPSSLSELTVALQAAKRLILAAGNFYHNVYPDGAAQKIASQFHHVTWKLEKALANLPYDHFDISEDVKEQVDLVRIQLRRAIERYGGPKNPIVLSCGLSEPLDKEFDPLQTINTNTGILDHHGVESKTEIIPKENLLKDSDEMISGSENASVTASSVPLKTSDAISKKLDSPVIPDDFLCPISLELIRDPVIVSTGQTYERSYIQRWMDCGNTTCPKTQQKLQNLTLTPNYVLRSLITQWCTNHNLNHPTLPQNRRLKKTDGSFLDVTQSSQIIQNLSSASIEEQRNAVYKIRSLSKKCTDNRILIAESGAIPILIKLLSSKDNITQEHAVTSILNLSIYENNKQLIMLANAVPLIIHVLKEGTMEARENAAATLFSLSLCEENKIIIGASGAIPALVDLLENGSLRGKKDAATALFNLCMYGGNKGRAVRAGIVAVLVKMVADSGLDSGGSMMDEGLTILSVLVSHREAKTEIMKANNIIPNLIDFIRTGVPRNKENAASILVSLCKRDDENIGVLRRLGAVVPLTELAKNGSERAKRKANSLLERLERC